MDMLMPLSERYQDQSTTGSKKNDRSVFVMVTFENNVGGLDGGILYEFKIKHGGGGQIIIGGIEQEEQIRTLGGEVVNMALQPAAEFFQGGGSCYLICARFCSSSKLYLLRDTFYSGIIFDTTTTQATTMYISSSSSSLFSRPIEYYAHGPLISAYGKLYYFADPLSSPHSRGRTTFQCYDPTNDSWERLPPCPFYSSFGGWEFDTVGFAVSGGCILFSLKLCVRYKFELLVYHIPTQKWHKPKRAGSDYCEYFPFYGRAVVVDDDTIYAPTYATGDMLVIKFSLRWLPVDAVDGDGSYFIDSLTVLPGLEIVLPPPKSSLRCIIYTYYMVHLGDFEFCLVYNYTDPLYRKNLCITTFRIVRDDSSMQCIKTLRSTVADFYLPPNNNHNHILFSFTPDYDDDTQSKEEYKTATTVKLAKHRSVGAFDAKKVTAKKMRRVKRNVT